MLFRAVLIDALHAALEDAVVTFNRVGRNVTANVFLFLVVHTVMAGELLWVTKVFRGERWFVNAMAGTNKWLEANPPEPR